MELRPGVCEAKGRDGGGERGKAGIDGIEVGRSVEICNAFVEEFEDDFGEGGGNRLGILGFISSLSD